MWVRVQGEESAHRKIHARTVGLLNVMKQWSADSELNFQDQKKIDYLIKNMTEIIREDTAGLSDSGMREEWVEPAPDANCEFYEIDQHKITCALGCDMYHCSKQCCYATDNPASIPPYKTKYMNRCL